MNESSRSSQSRRAGPLWAWLVGFISLLVAIWIILTLAAAPASAQQVGPQRSSFAFIEDHLTITVRVDAPGVLRITRGSVGLLGVAGRAVRGFTSAGLSEPAQDHLNLTAVGADEVAYLVTVPAGVRVRVQLPGRRASATMGGFEEVATFRWDVSASAAELGSAARAPAARPRPRRPGTPAGSAYYLAYTNRDAPALFTVSGLGSIRTLTVRWQGDSFRVLTQRRSKFLRGDPDAFGLRATGAPQDVVVVVPRHANEFTLRLGGVPALILDSTTGAETLCQPVVAQRLDRNRRWFTFTPDDGALACRPPRALDRARRST